MEQERAVHEQTVVTRGERVAYQRIDEGGVLLHLETGAYHRINAVGAVVWEAIGDASTLEDVTIAVEHSLDGPVPDSLSTDVEEFVESLVQRNLVSAKAP
jgi:hypothetical protein